MKTNVNSIVVFHPNNTQALFCKRKKNPYKGLYNFVGGHIEPGESGADAAYRELYEETGITRAQIELCRIMDYNFYTSDIHLEIWFGRLKEEVAVHGEENELLWLDKDNNFFDITRFAGDGNIGHIMRIIELSEK